MKTILISVMILILSACSSTTYVTQENDNAYIQFYGNIIDTQVTVGEINFEINKQTESFDLNGKQVVKFEIPKGKHQLTISKQGQIIISKYVFATEGQTIEVSIP